MSPVNTGGKNAENLVTHSICCDCADNLEFQLGISLKTYLESLHIPIVAFDGNGTVIGINAAASAAYKGKAIVESAKWQEKVFECAHARLPDGCKNKIHCSGCAIRIAATQAFNSGKEIINIPAHLNHCSSDLCEKIELLISADKVDSIVFLRIVKL
ncbi:MAG: hypothetical protein HXX17_12675 [Geobacteraceae bacterium]|nr:hypothetical protein [Geobacteraceae bacterium]